MHVTLRIGLRLALEQISASYFVQVLLWSVPLMPRYFFHVHDGTALIDPDGIELPGADEARGEAVRVAFDALNKSGPRFRESGKWLLRVTDENGESICVMTFSGEVPAQLARVGTS